MSYVPLSGDVASPSARRAAQLRQRDHAQRLALGEQRRLTRQMQALSAPLRSSARPRGLADRLVDDGGLSDVRR